MHSQPVVILQFTDGQVQTNQNSLFDNYTVCVWVWLRHFCAWKTGPTVTVNLALGSLFIYLFIHSCIDLKVVTFEYIESRNTGISL